jgi:hypothetical protein
VASRQNFRTVPYQVPKPKAEARRKAEKALREFMQKESMKPVSIIPDDDDGREPPLSSCTFWLNAL